MCNAYKGWCIKQWRDDEEEVNGYEGWAVDVKEDEDGNVRVHEDVAEDRIGRLDYS